MADLETIERIEQDCLTSIRLKTDAAKRGHDFVVLGHSLDAFRLLELAALAKIGLRIVTIAAGRRGGAVHSDEVECVIINAEAAERNARDGGKVEKSKWKPTHRHKKRGTEYAVVGTATIQTGSKLTDGEMARIYKDRCGRVWVRAVSEFTDGRFEIIAGEKAGSP